MKEGGIWTWMVEDSSVWYVKLVKSTIRQGHVQQNSNNNNTTATTFGDTF